MAIKFKESKFKTLVHYICHQCEDSSRLGSTKLNKILWFSDALAYLNFGTPITGEQYVKRQYGPVPNHILKTLESLEGTVLVKDTNFHGYPKREFISLKEPDMSKFSQEEIVLIDDIIETVCNDHTATSISDLSHNRVWKAAKIGETLPYETIFVCRSGEIDEHDMEWANEAATEIAA